MLTVGMLAHLAKKMCEPEGVAKRKAVLLPKSEMVTFSSSSQVQLYTV